MFTWICPQCGREVPPSASECPDCEGKTQATPSAGARFPTTASEPVADTLKPPAAPAARRAAPPAWLLAFVFAIVFLTMGALGFLAYRYFSHPGEPLLAGPINPIRTPQTPPAVSATPSANVLNKYIEVTGLRLVEDRPEKLEVEFVIVNHSSAPLIDVAGEVTIRPTTSQPDGEAVASFAFRIPELRPYEAKNMRAPLQSKLRVYELPDWQFMRADVTITSPRPDP